MDKQAFWKLLRHCWVLEKIIRNSYEKLNWGVVWGQRLNLTLRTSEHPLDTVDLDFASHLTLFRSPSNRCRRRTTWLWGTQPWSQYKGRARSSSPEALKVESLTCLCRTVDKLGGTDSNVKAQIGKARVASHKNKMPEETPMWPSTTRSRSLISLWSLFCCMEQKPEEQLLPSWKEFKC